MRLIDCINETDSHWTHDGSGVIVCPPVMSQVEKLEDLMVSTAEKFKSILVVDNIN